MNAFAVKALDRRRLQPVPILQAFRYEMDNVGAEELERTPQDDRRGDTVDVVIAVDRDALAPSDRRHDPVGRERHVGQHCRVVEMAERWVQKSAGDLRILQPALTEQLRYDSI